MKLSAPGLRAALEVDQRPVHGDLGQPGQRSERDLLDARLGGGGQGDRVPVAAQPAIHPQNVDHGLGCLGLRGVCLCVSGHREATSSLVRRLDAGRAQPGRCGRCGRSARMTGARSVMARQRAKLRRRNWSQRTSPSVMRDGRNARPATSRRQDGPVTSPDRNVLSPGTLWWKSGHEYQNTQPICDWTRLAETARLKARASGSKATSGFPAARARRTLATNPGVPHHGVRAKGEGPVAEPIYGPSGTPIEVVPVVVLSQVFPARPSSIPDIRDFVRRCLAESPLTEEGTREVGETVFRALLDAAGPTGSIQVAFRIFPEHVEVDVLHSDTAIQSPVMPGPPRSYTLPPAAGPAGRSRSRLPPEPSQSHLSSQSLPPGRRCSATPPPGCTRYRRDARQLRRSRRRSSRKHSPSGCRAHCAGKG